MVHQNIIAPVTTPTKWVSSLVVVKKNPANSDCVLIHEISTEQYKHFPIPTIEDVATRLHGAKVFTKGAFHLTELTGQTGHLGGLTLQRLQINKSRG